MDEDNGDDVDDDTFRIVFLVSFPLTEFSTFPNVNLSWPSNHSLKEMKLG